MLATVSNPAAAQLPNIKKKAEEAAKKKADEATKRAAADSAKKAAAQDSAAKADSAKAKAGSGTPQASAKVDPKVWDNYDFVPGNKVIFYTDFSEDKVGNFARGLKFKAGAMDVVERDGVKMLRSTSRGEFMVPVGKKLPERFTLEIDVISAAEGLGGYDHVAFEGGSIWDRDEKSAEVNWTAGGTVIIGGGQTAGTSNVKFPDALAAQNYQQVAHIRVLVDGPYFKLYNNERRIYNIPELGFKRDSVIRFLVKGAEEPNQATYISLIRVAESEVDILYDALTAKGRWATQGILFETGKADLKPESRPVLKEIASTMQKYPDLKILIEGHTDNVGSAASNLTLSDNRAAAVKAALVADFGLAEDRMTTKGLGDTKPSVPNATPAGRAQNRRVEIVKQ
jgi:outer membrane protein OmpA-like peptidoglycan-associated protein